jgi:hypothetical protein
VFLDLGSRMRVLAAQGAPTSGRLVGHFAQFDPPDANDKLVAFRATLDQASREGVFLASPRATGLLVGSTDPAPGGAVFRSFPSVSLGGTSAVFLARLRDSSTPPGLYRVSAAAVPAGDAPAPAAETLGLPGGPSPLGGTIAEFTSVGANRKDTIAAVVDLVGASARSALVLIDPGGAIVP